jgi:hypothetical protein
MKKLFLGGFLPLCVFMLSSCLEGGSNERSQSGIPGIIRFDTKIMRTVISAPEFGSFYFYDPQLETLGFVDGDCVLFGYTVDFSAEINSNYQNTGIIQGTVSSIGIIDQYPCHSSLVHDTAMLIENERPIAYAVSTNGYSFYFSDKLFLTSDFSQNTDQKTSWLLYYDGELPTKTVEGKTVYTLFLRAVMTDSDKAPIINTSVINVFNAGFFFDEIMHIEKNQGNTDVYFQIQHIRDIKTDGAFTWEHSDVLSISIPDETE